MTKEKTVFNGKNNIVVKTNGENVTINSTIKVDVGTISIPRKFNEKKGSNKAMEIQIAITNIKKRFLFRKM